MKGEKRECSNCKRYFIDLHCQELVDWIGEVFALECNWFSPEEPSVVKDLMLESWR